MTKFHDFKFKVNEKPEQEYLEEYHKIKISSKITDGEAYLYSINGGGSYSLYLKDRFFNFNVENDSKNIASFEGDLQLNKIRFVQLQLPKKIKDVILSLDTTSDLPSGCGGYIKFNSQDIYYDKQNKILQIGNIYPEETTYKIFNNGYTQVKKNNITGLMFTDLEL